MPLDIFRRRTWPDKSPGPTPPSQIGPRPRYRRPPHSLTDSLLAEIVASVAKGATLAATAKRLGIPGDTLAHWLARGRAEADGSVYHQLAVSVDATRRRQHRPGRRERASS